MSSDEHGIERIRRLAGHAERRLRFDRALGVGAKALCVALGASIGVVLASKLGWLRASAALPLFVASGVGVAGAVAIAWAWRLPARAGARALDRFHDLHDRLASALAFAGESTRTPLMEAAISDAIEAAPLAKPRQAVPIHVPRALAAAAGLGAVLVAAAVVKVPAKAPVAHAKTIDPVDMAPDDLDDVKDFLKRIEQKDPTDDTKAAIDEFNKLVADIANKRLDRTEAFRRMEALEQKLLTGSDADKKALEAQLERVGEEMKKAELTKPAGAALADNRLEDARDALNDLAKKMREHPAAIDKAKLEQMREALKKAAEDAEKRAQELEQRRQQLADEILKAKEKMGDGGTDEERSLLEKKQRELDRLDRNLDEQKNANRQLDRLDRELEEAAEDLMKDLGLSADDLDRGAEDLNRMDQSQATEQEKEELKQKLQELRELLRQQGQNGKAQVMRLRRFGRMARGQSGQQGQGGDQGDGKGDQGQGKDDPGENGDGQGQNGNDPHGDKGQGGTAQGNGSGETWVLGPNGEKLLMLSKGGSGEGQGEGSGHGGEGHGGEGQGKGGHEWGVGHDPNTQGKATNPQMTTQDTQVQGTDAQGASRSQVILGAAERGFASRGYKKVYTEYHQVAEESLAKDEIPGGYRFYVKRYFQLIRPREE